jgi:hypothetical protein
LADWPTDLARIVTAWTDLPEKTHRAILALVDVALNVR